MKFGGMVVFVGVTIKPQQLCQKVFNNKITFFYGTYIVMKKLCQKRRWRLFCTYHILGISGLLPRNVSLNLSFEKNVVYHISDYSYF